MDTNFMLQSIRDNAQGLVSKILVGLIAFTFVIWGADSLFTFSTDSGAPATVNGEDISLQKLAQKSELNRRQLLISNPDLDPVALDMQTIQANTLEQLIKQEIFLQLAAESSMAFGTSSVDQIIVDTPEFQVDGKFDLQRFQSLIGGAGLTANTYKQQLIENNLLNQINQGVTATAFSLPEQVNLIAKLDGQTRSIDTLVLSFAQQLANTEISAEQILNNYDEESLQNILYKYGDIKNSKIIAKEIVTYRNKKKIISNYDLLDAIRNISEKKLSYKFLSKLYQAIRIEVNDEINSLKEILRKSVEFLNSSGRLVVISYHSIEDRLVKNFINKSSFDSDFKKDLYGKKIEFFKRINKKPIVPSEEEKKNNSRSRSAKLRIGERL